MRRQASRALRHWSGRIEQANALVRLLSSQAKPPAFVFDIDGVLIRGQEVLEPARKALARLYTSDGKEPRYPVCFLTNGGGVLESEKAAQLTSWLDVNVSADQVILSHTPFKQLVGRLGSEAVMVAGRHDVEAVARSYGFRSTVTSAQLAAAHPRAVPFASVAFPCVDTPPLNRPELSSSKGVTRSGKAPMIGSVDSPIKAILVFTDPSDWYLDLQLMTELIATGGVVGGRLLRRSQSPVEVVFSNPDKVFANEHPTPRFGQGAFAVALAALLKEVAECRPSEWRVFGKPNREPYDLALKVLRRQAGLLNPSAGAGEPPFGQIYMVGDNPESDIAGARRAGEPWQSILVRTGVFSGPGPNSERHPADVVVENVLDAVEAGLHRSRAQKWHSMR